MRMCEVVSNNVILTEEIINKVIKKHKDAIKDYAYVLHDKDFYVREDIEKWEEECEKNPDYANKQKCPVIGAPKPPHWHVGLHLNSDYKYADIAKWFDLPENFVGKVKAQRFEQYLPYLVHANRQDKRSYPINAIHTNINNIAELIEKNVQFKTKAQIKEEEKLWEDEIYRNISMGKWKQFEIYKYIGADDYRKYDKLIEKALKYYNSIGSLEHKKTECSVLWIYGGGGVGKTTFAECLCESRNMEYGVSDSGSDVFGNYKGERQYIIDDLEKVNFTFKELLKILDSGHKKGAAKSRFYNKNISDIEFFVVTASCSPEDYFKAVCENEIDGKVEQLLRRLSKGVIKINRDGICEISNYDGFGRLYSYEKKPLPQVVTDKIEEKRKSIEEQDPTKDDFLGQFFR